MELSDIRFSAGNIRADGNKDLSMSLSVYRSPKMAEAKVALVVFSKEKRGGPIFEAVFSRGWIAAVKQHWANLLVQSTPGDKVSATYSKREWDDAKKGFNSTKVGTVTFGIDSGGRAYIGITDNSGNMKFPLYTDSSYTYRDELASPEANRIAVAGWLSYLDACENAMNMSLLVPAVRDDNGGRGGGGRGGYSGNRSGGASAGGGARSGGDIDNEITF